MNMRSPEFSPIREISKKSPEKEVFEVSDPQRLAEMIALATADSKTRLPREVIETKLIKKFNNLKLGEQMHSYYEGKKVTVERTEKGFKCTTEMVEKEIDNGDTIEVADDDIDLLMAA
jgi:hypothetical protein